LLGQDWGLVIGGIEVTHFFSKLVVITSGQPVADQMGFDIPFFLKDDRRVGLKSWLQCLA
jgi:hypothetical protein